MGNKASTQTVNDTELHKQSHRAIYKRTAPQTSVQSNNITQSDEDTTSVGFKMNLRPKVKVSQNAVANRNGKDALESPTRPKRQRKQTPNRLDFLYGRYWPDVETAKSTFRTNASKQSNSKRAMNGKHPASKLTKNAKNKRPTRNAAQFTRSKIAGKPN